MITGLRHKWRYRFENFMSRGWVSVFISLLVLFIAFLLLVLIIRTAVLIVGREFSGELDSWSKHYWVLVQEYTSSDVLELVSDYSLGLKISSLFTLLVGMVFFSMLIAFINTRMEKIIYNFRKGRSPVIESGHTLILGWNERLFDLLPELVAANESRSKPAIVILAEQDKEWMDDEIFRAITDMKNSRVVTRTGSPTSLKDLQRVNAAEARSAIILSRTADSASIEQLDIADTMSLKTILALFAIQNDRNRLSIVAEVYTEKKRALIRSFGSHLLNCVNRWVILGKVLVQTSRSQGTSSGLALVYDEMFSYRGSELYFFRADWESVPFGQMYRYLDDGIPLGIRDGKGNITLRPPVDTVLEADEDLIVLAEDDSKLRRNPRPVAPFPQFACSGQRYDKSVEHELLLGWSPTVPVVIREYSDYLIEGSTIHIMLENPSDRIAAIVDDLSESYPHLEISLIRRSPLDRNTLASVDPFSYDNVIILAQRENPGSLEEVDADTLVILLLLRQLRSELADQKRRSQTITQVMNADNQELMVSSMVDDFIVGNRMITMLLAQLSEQPDISKIYEELFSEAGSEIYLKQAHLYFEKLPLELPFGSVLEAASQRGEICIGVREKTAFNDAGRNYGITLNPDKQRVFRIHSDDTLVVLAEDEC